MLMCKKIALSLLSLAFLLAFSGCAAMHGLRESPQISLADVELQKAGLMENAFRLQLRVTNPNRVAIDLRAMTCELNLNGRHFARGANETPARVEAYSSTVVPVMVYSSMMDMAGALARMVRSGVRDGDSPRYALEGEAIFEVNGHEMREKFTSDGDFTWGELGRSLRGE